jgi:UDP-N-acetylmuramoylalanine--D-glutamate ligase
VITARAFAGKKYAVLGLARSGAATVEALLASGAQVVAWDESEAARQSVLSHPGGGRDPLMGISAEMGSGLRRNDSLSFADPLTVDLTGYAGMVVSPGVPINRHPIAAHARAHGVPLIGDIELFAQARTELPAHKVVGITGTNGKSTTTALVHHILKTAGVPTRMGGNIGLPILAQDPLPEGGVYVLELSSYQIDLTYSLRAAVAVLLNVTPDHLERYDSFEAYRSAKLRLFGMQWPTQSAIVTDGPGTSAAALDTLHKTRAHMRFVTTSFQELLGVCVSAGEAYIDGDLISRQADWPALQGPHNAENAGAAIAVALEFGLTPEQIDEGLRTYPGLLHRMERVRERRGVLFVNDSKATNPESAAPALAAYPYIHWIVGGRAKAETLGPCADHLDHVRGAYTIGEAGPMFARLLAGKVPVTEAQVLEKAVTAAAGAAKAGEVVLLSPACASFDQFKDFEARGDAFRAAVEALP